MCADIRVWLCVVPSLRSCSLCRTRIIRGTAFTDVENMCIFQCCWLMILPHIYGGRICRPCPIIRVLCAAAGNNIYLYKAYKKQWAAAQSLSQSNVTLSTSTDARRLNGILQVHTHLDTIVHSCSSLVGNHSTYFRVTCNERQEQYGGTVNGPHYRFISFKLQSVEAFFGPCMGDLESAHLIISR